MFQSLLTLLAGILCCLSAEAAGTPETHRPIPLHLAWMPIDSPNLPLNYFNTLLGTGALSRNAGGARNTAVGGFALNYNAAGSGNTAVGYNALSSNLGGDNNTAFGTSSLEANNTGFGNSALGNWSLFSNCTGQLNTAVGNKASVDNISGSYNTALGACAGNGKDQASNTLCLGYSARACACNHVVIGNTSMQWVGGYTNWSTISDERFKTGIKENVPGLSFILQLRPITYHLDIHRLNHQVYGGAEDSLFCGAYWDNALLQKEQIVYSGFSAQQVDSAAARLGYAFSGVTRPQNSNGTYSLSYADFVVPLVKAVQEQQQQIQQQQALIQSLISQEQVLAAKIRQLNQELVATGSLSASKQP